MECFIRMKNAVSENNFKELQRVVDDYPPYAKKNIINDDSTVELIRKRMINHRDNDGNTLLHFAVMQRRILILNYLVALDGINPNLPNQLGETALMLAAQNNHIEESVTLFSIDNLNVNLRGRDAQTPLLKAASEGFVELCNVLIGDASTKIHLKDIHNKSVLDYLFEKKILDKLSGASIARIKGIYPNFEPGNPASWLHPPQEISGRLIALFELPPSATDGLAAMPELSTTAYTFSDGVMRKIFTPLPGENEL